MSAPFPWQDRQWRQLWSAYQTKRLPHALLLKGTHGLGISQFARQFAATLLCDAPIEHGMVCKQCKSCLLYQAGNHPELARIEPEDRGKSIKIDQIRALAEFVTLKSHYGHFKIVILDPAEAMNRNAANSLLKTLEEPPPGTLLMLVSHRPMLLPVTVRSRCQSVNFNIPPGTVTQAWLAAQTTQKISPSLPPLLMLADEAPLTVLERLESGLYTHYQGILNDLQSLITNGSDPIEVVAHQWSKIGAEEVLLWLLNIIEQLIKFKSTHDPAWISNLDTESRLRTSAEDLDVFKLFGMYDKLINYRHVVASQTNIVALNLLEEFAIQWTTVLEPCKRL
jgi:DNA polymerase III subunit delta'